MEPLKESIALNPTLNIAIEYGQCPKCLYVFGSDEDFTKVSLPCPKCGDVGRSREIWPGNIYKRQLFPVLQELYSKRTQFGAPIIVFAFAITEGLLRCCLHNALRKKGMEYLAAEQCVDEISNTEKINRLLAKLCNCNSLSNLLKNTKFHSLLSEWEDIRTLRNKIVHANKATVRIEDTGKAFTVCVYFPMLLRYILNQVSP
jgi:ssDNA-binding Zn-finger/Zn-ribbon topoisomerase 1